MHIPKVLYKYCSIDTAKLILEKATLRWSAPRSFNDLFEFSKIPVFSPGLDDSLPAVKDIAINIAFGDAFDLKATLSPRMLLLIRLIAMLKDSGLSKEDVIRELADYEDVPVDPSEEIRAFVYSWIDSCRVLCLSSECDNELMWTHYAATHSGCALGFSTDKIDDNVFSAASPVVYTDEPVVLGSGVDFLLYGDSWELRNKTLNGICHSKSKKWEYEKEWRLVDHGNNAPDDQYSLYGFDPRILESVTFGVKCSQEDLQVIRDLVVRLYPSCRFYQLKIGNDQFLREELPHQ